MAYDDEDYYVYLPPCCFLCSYFHVESCAFAIAIIGILLSFIGAFCAPFVAANVIPNIVILLCCVGIIGAQKFRIWALYIPFVFLLTLVAVSLTIFGFLLAIFSLFGKNKYGSSYSFNETMILLGVSLNLFVAAYFVAWLQKIVRLALKCMRRENQSDSFA